MAPPPRLKVSRLKVSLNPSVRIVEIKYKVCT